jgi:dual specificity phosphatase 12
MSLSSSMPKRRWRSPRQPPSVRGPYFPAKEIVRNLWIGSEGDSGDRSFFKKHNIRLVVNATKNIPMRLPSEVRGYRVPVDDAREDNDTMLRHLPLVVLAIDEVLSYDQGVLVHCRAGMQRSAAVVAAYLMWKRGMTTNEVLEFINSRKHETFWPVPTFEAALRAWEDQLRRNGRVS